MSVQLLDKTRKINKLLHNSSSSKVVFNDICQVLMETLSSNILVLSKKGKVLGVSICPGVDEITELIDDKIGGHIDPLLNERFLGVLSTKENVNLQTLGFEHVPGNYQGIVNPIDIAGERLGTLFMYRNDHPYDIEDIIEPSAGNGAFSSQIKCTAYDIEPEFKDIIKADFLKENIEYKKNIFPFKYLIFLYYSDLSAERTCKDAAFPL